MQSIFRTWKNKKEIKAKKAGQKDSGQLFLMLCFCNKDKDLSTMHKNNTKLL